MDYTLLANEIDIKQSGVCTVLPPEQQPRVTQDLVLVINPSDEGSVLAWLRCRDNSIA